MFGNYSIKFLNQNKNGCFNLMIIKQMNMPISRSYVVIPYFDWAEWNSEYIEMNRPFKTISRIKATKKIKLQEAKRDEDLYLTLSELRGNGLKCSKKT